MAGQDEKNIPLNQSQQDKSQQQETEKKQDDILALDTDDEMEDLVDSIEEKERTMKDKKKD